MNSITIDATTMFLACIFLGGVWGFRTAHNIKVSRISSGITWVIFLVWFYYGALASEPSFLSHSVHPHKIGEYFYVTLIGGGLVVIVAYFMAWAMFDLLQWLSGLYSAKFPHRRNSH
jgi:hypothetical protein